MLRPADVQEALRASSRPLGTDALAVLLDAHWSDVAELMASLERKGDVVWSDRGWGPRPDVHAPALLVRPTVPNPAQP